MPYLSYICNILKGIFTEQYWKIAGYNAYYFRYLQRHIYIVMPIYLLTLACWLINILVNLSSFNIIKHNYYIVIRIILFLKQSKNKNNNNNNNNNNDNNKKPMVR